MTMGTAATMTALPEALGMTLPGASSIPAADSNHVRMAIESGRRIVEMVWDDVKPREDILTMAAFRKRNCGGYGAVWVDQCDHSPGSDGPALRLRSAAGGVR